MWNTMVRLCCSMLARSHPLTHALTCPPQLFYMRKGGPITRILAPSQHMKAGDKEKYISFIGRLQSCHQNDMENILPFLLLAFLYVQCGFHNAAVYFYTFTAARIMHTVMYLGLKQQPWRTLFWGVGVYCTCSMAIQMVMLAGKSSTTANLATANLVQ